MIVWRGDHYYVAVDERGIAVSSSSPHTVCSVAFSAADWPAVRDAVDNALADKAEK